MSDVTCPSCQAILEYDDADKGTLAECPACGGDINLPATKTQIGIRILKVLGKGLWRVASAVSKKTTIVIKEWATKNNDLTDEQRLERWKKAKAKTIKKSDDPPVQFLIDNIGTERTIRYYGKFRKVIPIRVFEKEDGWCPYLEAKTDEGTRVFKFEHITLPGKKWGKYYADAEVDDDEWEDD